MDYFTYNRTRGQLRPALEMPHRAIACACRECVQELYVQMHQDLTAILASINRLSGARVGGQR